MPGCLWETGFEFWRVCLLRGFDRTLIPTRLTCISPRHPNRSVTASGMAQVSRHSRQRMHSALRIISGIPGISTGHSASQRLQCVQRSRSMTTRRGDILLKTTSNAPNGLRYLHQKRFTSIEVTIKVRRTLARRGVVS